MLVIMKIINTTFITTIEDICKKVFPNLRISDLKKVQKYVIIYIDLLAMKFGFDESNVSQFYTLLNQNNKTEVVAALVGLYITNIGR